MRLTATLFALAGLSGLLACSDSPTSPGEQTTPVREHATPPPDVGTPVERIADVPATATIAFVSTRAGAAAIYVANADGSGVTRVTKGWAPAWSMDGRRIAIERAAGDSGPAGLWVIDLDRAEVRYVGSGLQPTWSPDGRIAFIRLPWQEPAGTGLYVMNPDGSGITELLAHAWLCPPSADCADRYAIVHPAWSPDGRSIALQAFRGAGGYQRSLAIVNADGSDPRLLHELLDLGPESAGAFSRGINTGPAWSPDGSTIAVITGNPWFISSYPYVIYTYDAASGGLQAVHTAPGFGRGGAPDNPAWSPDANRIVFDAASRDGDPRGHRRIFTASIETGEVLQLIPDDPANADYRDWDAVWFAPADQNGGG
jgi:Tol biopolymer transport system component